MKNLIFIFLLISSFFANAQDSTSLHKPKKVIYGETYYETGELKTHARYKLYYFPAIKGGCTQGTPARTDYILDGKWTEYYKNGNKMKVVIYKDGKVTKIRKQWDENGDRIR